MSERKDTLPASVEFFPGGANVTFGLSGTSIEVLEDYNQITPSFRRRAVKAALPSLVESLLAIPGKEEDQIRMRRIISHLNSALAIEENPFVQAVEGQEDY